ncbi:MAG TPA: hypothetical protein VFQ38_08870 [Longimicrobiales bacterium]|nr:hypothetical protein [Longimicrobiales bacterium]
MDDNTVAMVVTLALIFAVSGVVLLRPIVKKLAVFLEVAAEARRRALAGNGVDEVRSRLGAIEGRLASLEAGDSGTRELRDQVRFLEQLVAERQGSTALPRRDA